MKKLMYFVGVCALCATMATACTDNEPENNQEINSLNVEQIEDINQNIFSIVIEKMENKVPIKLDNEYFMIDMNDFTDIFNQVLLASENLEGIVEWKHTIEEDDSIYKEMYRTGINGSSIKLVKSKTGEKYLGIVIDSLYTSREDLYSVSNMLFLVSAICEESDISEKFINDMVNSLNAVVTTEEKQYVYGKGKKYCFSYDSKIGMITFYIMPSSKTEEQIIAENLEEVLLKDNGKSENEKEINETATDTSTPTEQEIEIYNYINSLLEIGADTSQEPSVSEIASYFGISEEMVDGNYKAYKQGYLEHTYEDYCDKLTSEKYGISIDEINKIWTKVYSYENK